MVCLQWSIVNVAGNFFLDKIIVVEIVGGLNFCTSPNKFLLIQISHSAKFAPSKYFQLHVYSNFCMRKSILNTHLLISVGVSLLEGFHCTIINPSTCICGRVTVAGALVSVCVLQMDSL